MDAIKKRRRYSELVVGFLSFGLGQRLLVVGVVKPWAEERQIVLFLAVLGFILWTGGIILLIRLLSWLLKNYNQNNRVLKVLAISLVASVTAGILIGFVGQFLYDKTSISYSIAKTSIWVLSSLIQASIKMTALYSLITFYQGKELSFKQKEFKFILLLALLMLGFAHVLSIFLPS
ncbi:hypothetical protein BN1356_01105 [Streptococcus varani]|uniref:Uncharacterized protein n=1 Tax=Streptococcus varani TaxID=1608583 RepID=A0A0E4H526_9STRE|nr:hypothetical protein [Streptococcus varani]CQR24749.1 hypothetical protein BN1356_01105 [Streptococcus varani]